MAEKFDLCIIGAGSGGLSVAAAAAQFGRKVALIEKAAMGGDCLNHGCVPSKALIAAAARAHAITSCGDFGIKPTKPSINGAAVFAHVRDVIAQIAPDDSEERFTRLGCRVIRAAARFVTPDLVEAGGVEVTARRFVIATGSRPFVPDVPGLTGVGFLTNETIFALDRIPEHLLVMGGGPIGLEMAQAFRRLGAEVTVMEQAPGLLIRDDPELAAVVAGRLSQEGVNILTSSRVIAVSPQDKSIMVEIETLAGKQMVSGSHLLVATGRRPDLAGLGLDRAGVTHGPRGIDVDGSMRTSNRRIYAIGDVATGPQFTHLANYQAGLVIRNALFRLPVKSKPDLIPWVTYTDPELAQVGLSEAEAQRRNLRFNVLRWPFVHNDRARAARETEGLVKIIASPNGRILGAGIAGAHAGELIAPFCLALSRGLKLSHLAGLVLPYPTLSEAGKRAAMSHFVPLAKKPALRWLLGALARLG